MDGNPFRKPTICKLIKKHVFKREFEQRCPTEVEILSPGGMVGTVNRVKDL